MKTCEEPRCYNVSREAYCSLHKRWKMPQDKLVQFESGGSGRVRLTTVEKERMIREANPSVQVLYDEYRVALILAGGEDL